MNQKQEFLRLFDRAIEKAETWEKRAEGWEIESSKMAVRNLRAYRESLLSDKLPPKKGSSLALSKHLGEIGAPDELYKVALEIDAFYRNEWLRHST